MENRSSIRFGIIAARPSQVKSTGVIKLPPAAGTVRNAYLLADPAHAPLKFTQTTTEVAIELPAKALDPIATVLVLETK